VRSNFKYLEACAKSKCHSSDETDARYPQARKAPTRSIFKRAHVRQPRTTAVNPACGCSRDRNEEQDSGLRHSSVERNKEGDGFVRFRWGETKKQEANGRGARLMIETGAEFPIGPIVRHRGECALALAAEERARRTPARKSDARTASPEQRVATHSTYSLSYH
jgi:hypothetical protein